MLTCRNVLRLETAVCEIILTVELDESELRTIQNSTGSVYPDRPGESVKEANLTQDSARISPPLVRFSCLGVGLALVT